jgi:thiol-disulfide isomerase/thioredoxin
MVEVMKMGLLTRRTVVGAAAAAGAASLVGVLAWRKLAAPPPGFAPSEPDGVAMRPLSDIQRVSPPGVVPDVTCTALDGATRHLLADWHGRVVVLNFWATWCIPCVAELPALDRLAAEEPGFAVLAVSADRSGAEVVSPFLKAHGIVHLTTLLDPHMAVGQAFGVAGFPTTLVIDAAGRLRGRLEGPADWASAGAAVRALVG